MRFLFLLFPFFLSAFTQPTLLQGTALFHQPAENILEIWTDGSAFLLWENFIVKEGEEIHFQGTPLSILTKGFCKIDGRIRGRGDLLFQTDDFVLGETGAIQAHLISISIMGTGVFQGNLEADIAVLLEGINIEIQKPLISNSSASWRIWAHRNCQIFSTLGNLQRGDFSFFVGESLLLQASPASTAQIFAQGGKIEIEARDLILEGSGTAAEILALNGDVRVRLERDLTLSGGKGGYADVFARIAGQNIDLEIKRDAMLIGGDGSRSMSELSAQNFLSAKIGRDLKIMGGISTDRSFACISGVESVDMDVLGNVILTSGPGDSVQISSRWGSLALEIGGSLFLQGDPKGGSARIKSYESIHISSPTEVRLENGKIFSKRGELFLKATKIGADAASFFSAPSTISFIGEQIWIHRAIMQVDSKE